MFKFIFNKIFSKNAALYKILTIENLKQELNSTFDDLIENTIDGVIVRNFYDRSILNSIISGQQKLKELEHPNNFGSVIGYPLNKSSKDLSEYLHFNVKTNSAFETVISKKYKEQFFEMIGRMTKKHQFNVPESDLTPYILGTLRVMQPNQGGLMAHTGNEFVDLQKERGLFELNTRLNLINSFSYFIVIQESEKGGDLELFNLLWKDTPNSLKGFNANKRDDAKFEKMKKQVIKLKAGDLLMFRGGDIWHRVSPLMGEKSRITFGGFFAKSKESNEVLFWS